MFNYTKYYLISYYWQKDNRQGYGHRSYIVTGFGRLETKTLKSITDEISKLNNNADIVILNIMRTGK